MTTNVKVGPLSVVSLETLQSVYRVLEWYIAIRHNDPTPPTPSGEDDEAVSAFALTIREAVDAEEGKVGRTAKLIFLAALLDSRR